MLPFHVFYLFIKWYNSDIKEFFKIRKKSIHNDLTLGFWLTKTKTKLKQAEMEKAHMGSSHGKIQE